MSLAVNIVGAIVIFGCFGVILISANDIYPIQKVMDSNHAWWMHQPSQALLWVTDSNIVTDALILVMPMKVLWNLHISKTQKYSQPGIFALGLLYAGSLPTQMDSG